LTQTAAFLKKGITNSLGQQCELPPISKRHLVVMLRPSSCPYVPAKYFLELDERLPLKVVSLGLTLLSPRLAVSDPLQPAVQRAADYAKQSAAYTGSPRDHRSRQGIGHHSAPLRCPSGRRARPAH
jgi:hypothetical protein